MRRTDRLTRGRIASLAWPIILANAAVPLLGLADTAVIGHFASLEDLGAVAFGSVIFSFVYWGFGFLRMGTTGFVAQAAGAGDEAEVRAALVRALLLALAISLTLLLVQVPIRDSALFLLGGSDPVSELAGSYFSIRIWGAPATLGLFALVGILIGLGKSKTLLLVQLFLNGLNIALDILFAGVLDMGADGIALGTALAEWCSLLFALLIVWRLLRERHRDAEPFVPVTRLRALAPLRRTLGANSDIMIRTLLLVSSFAWFVRQSGEFGDAVLAANHILLQLISFSAFFLDGFAFVAEAVTGAAAGSGRRRRFDIAVRRSTELAAGSALLLAAGVLLGGEFAVRALTGHSVVQLAAIDQLLPVAVYILLSFAAFQLDGIFIGTTRTAEMRNATLAATAAFFLLSFPLTAALGVTGLWLALIALVLLRAVALLYYYPALRRSIRPATTSLKPSLRSPARH
ncbi:MAG: MATE family efflux transporter [Haliea sp.]